MITKGGEIGMTFVFEKLEVYQKALDFVEEIYVFCKSFRDKDLSPSIYQIKRASLSVPLNIAEGNGRKHKKEKLDFFHISRGSLLECVSIIQLIGRMLPEQSQKCMSLYHQAEQIGKMLSGLINWTK